MPKKSKKGKERLDKFYQLAKDQGYRSRAAFKLIQLAKKHDFLSKATVCIDLCAAPGGWAQVAQKHMPAGSNIIAIDLCPIKAIYGVTCIQSDITTDKCRSMVKKELLGKRADVVLHDGAPNVGANWSKDAYAQNELVLMSMKLACEHLRVGGTFVTKVFRSADYNSLLWVFGQLFGKVEATKPTASRNVSAEIFVLCSGFKGGKIDPKFFQPQWVFMQVLDPLGQETSSKDKGPAKTEQKSLNEYIKSSKKRHRSGYEEGDDLKIMSAADYIEAPNPAEKLVTHHRVSLTVKGSEVYDKHPETTDEIRELFADLKVLGKADLSKLLKWRMKIVREKEKADRAARKAEAEAADAKTGKAKGSAKAGLAGDVDAAIDGLLNEDDVKVKAKARAKAAAENSDDEHAAEEKLEEELAEQVQARRREERRDLKKMMERQKKSDLRRKMSLGSANRDSADQPDLFKASKKSILALENQDKYLDSSKLSSDDGDTTQEEDSDSDDGLDRLARLEVDVAVDQLLRKMRIEDKHRTKQQRIRKIKKETRRQRVIAAWSGEFRAFNDALEQKVGAEYAINNKDSDAEDDDDSDDEETDNLKALRARQEGRPGRSSTIDHIALEALVDGRPKGDDELASDAGDELGAQAGDEARASSSTALVPVGDGEDGDEALKAEHRVARWFSQDMFKSADGRKLVQKSFKLMPLDRESSDEGSDAEGGKMVELRDDQLPELPMTDKQKRQLKRKADTARNEARGRYGKKGKKGEEDMDDGGPMEVAPLELPRPLVPLNAKGQPLRPDDPQELAETLALGSILTESKKSRMDIIDAAYNRWSFERDDLLPDWFTEEEDRFNKPELPISKELMAQYRAKLREINARPIRKVAEARARKNRRLGKRLEKLRSTAMSLVDVSDMSELAKARQMRKAVNKLAKADERKVVVVNIKKGGGGKTDKGKVPKGAKVKVVDRRMKSDLRGAKKAAKRNKGKQKVQQKKKMVKRQAKVERGRRGAKAAKMT